MAASGPDRVKTLRESGIGEIQDAEMTGKESSKFLNGARLGLPRDAQGLVQAFIAFIRASLPNIFMTR